MGKKSYEKETYNVTSSVYAIVKNGENTLKRPKDTIKIKMVLVSDEEKPIKSFNKNKLEKDLRNLCETLNYDWFLHFDFPIPKNGKVCDNIKLKLKKLIIL